MTEKDYAATATRFQPRVLLAYPHHGQVHPWSARGFYRERLCSETCQIIEMESDTSFVPQGYNILLHSALKIRDRYGDNGPTHFAMIHADIAPQPGWVDILWHEMEEHGADAIAAVSPIKETEYSRTSTVIGNPNDPWKPIRSIQMTQRGQMPETFGIEHVGNPDTEFLQINTGCMLVDLRRPWWDIPTDNDTEGDFFAFALHQRVLKVPKTPEQIAAETEPNKPPPLPYDRVVQSRSEDWEMSRHIWRHGGKVVATWKVPLDHFGTFAWSNQARVMVRETIA